MVFIQDDLGGSGSRNTTREREKDDVYASKGGVVITVKNVLDVPDGTSLSDKKKLQGAYGNYVVIMDDNGKYWQYCHLKSTGVTENSIVNAGDYLGTIGNTGNSKTPHLHINVFENKEAYEDSSKPAYNRTINPLTEIRDGGKWPCNTMVSGSHNEIYPGKWGGNLYGYPHEGLDCSGNFGDPNKPNDTGNLIIGWNEFEINVEIASQGYDMYETQLEYKNRLENQYNIKVNQESLRYDKLVAEGDTSITTSKEDYMKTYKEELSNEYTNLLVTKDNKIDKNYNAVRKTVAKELEENYVMCQVIKSIKDDVLNNDLNFDDVSKILTSRYVDQSFYSGNKMRPSKNEELRETLFKLDTDLYERMLNDEENLLKVIRGEMTVESYANHIRNERIAAEEAAKLAAEQARIAEEARLAAEAEAARIAEEEAKAKAEEEKRKAEEEAKQKEEEEKRKAEEEAKQKEEEERKRKAEEEAKAKEEEERKRKEQQEADAEAEKDKEKQNTEGGNTSADDPKDEETETTTPTPEDEPPTTTTPVTTGNDNGGSGGSGPGNGGTPIAGGGEKIISGGGGKDGPELPENPDIWITSVGAPTLPDGFYVTRIAGLSSLNAAYEAAFEAGEIDMNFFDEVSNLRTVQSISLFAREELG